MLTLCTRRCAVSNMGQRVAISVAWVLCFSIALLELQGYAGVVPSSSIEIPSSRQFAPSPACCEYPTGVYAPSSLSLPNGPVSHRSKDLSPTEVLPPKAKDVIQFSSPRPSPIYITNTPPIMAHPPSIDSQAPSVPARPADGALPSSLISPTPEIIQSPPSNIYGKGPSSDTPTVEPPTQVTPAPDAGPIVSRAPSLPPGILGGGAVPVAAPPKEMPSHVPPPNDIHNKAVLVPALSPVPHEASKPRKYISSPTSLRPEPPSGQVVQVPAPSILLHPQKPREKYTNPASSPAFSLPPDVDLKRHGAPVAAPSKEESDHLSPSSHRHTTKGAAGPVPASSTIPSEAKKSHSSSAPSSHEHLPTNLVPVVAPSMSNHQHKSRKNFQSSSVAPSYFPPHSVTQGPTVSPSPLVHPSLLPKYAHHHAPPPFILNTASPIESPSSSRFASGSSAPSPLGVDPLFPTRWHAYSPAPSPSTPRSRKSRAPVHQPVQAFPPPPPNIDCLFLLCTEPYTNPAPGSSCLCALPIKVKLLLGVALYTFFPLVSELAQEISDGVFMNQSQVRVMGANAANEQPEKTIVLIDLVPMGQTFNNAVAFLTYERFWHKQIGIKASYFGAYDVLYVQYPGLPPSPPLPPSDMNMNDGPLGTDGNARTIKPLGVDVKKKRKENLSGAVVAIVVIFSVIIFILCAGVLWFLLLKLKHQDPSHLATTAPKMLMPAYVRTSALGTGPTLLGSGPASASESLSSSIATYAGTAKTFTVGEMERATNKFDMSRIIGEGGFGRVYKGELEDGTKVAVKVLKRDDHQGNREFLAEIEMLSRLHHRNLVKLIGICTEEHLRCLVYELIPNGSVESHLHGLDKEAAPLDWGARMKIALGSARALAYLHEDSSPSVIHRDFKSSNILLEYDYTPKVSDFGLARAKMDGGDEHISTRVMGTFGYVAPEYALTGHLLVKSDVYSYGVVLLELLTGRKPVDMSQPPGRENLVAWAHPLLTSGEDLGSIVDPALGSNFPFDSMVKVTAIASMCVQPEVSHRPFMGEVVQALKLVCSEIDEPVGSGSFNLEDLPPPDMENNIPRLVLSSEIFSTPAAYTGESSGSFRRHSSSGPLKMSRSGQFWQRMRGFSGESMSEDGRLSLRHDSNANASHTRSPGWS